MSVIVFDFDGTLAETWMDIGTALNRLFADEGFDAVPRESVPMYVGDGVGGLIASMVPEDRRAPADIAGLVRRFRRHYRDCCLDETRLYDGVLECLDALEGRTLAVASSKPIGFLEPMIKGLGVEDRFDLVLGGDSLPKKKPDPIVLTHVADHFDVDPTTLWMVGDTASDVGAAASVGATCIGCSYGYRGEARLREAGAEILVAHPQEIPNAIS